MVSGTQEPTNRTVFEQIRRSLNEILERATKPEDRRLVVTRMKQTLVQARMSIDEMRDGIGSTQRKLERENRELATVKRRKELALKINDAETVKVAEKYEQQLQERVTVLEQKVAAQARELELAEREVEDMKKEIRAAMAGGTPGMNIPLEDPLEEDDREARRAQTEIDNLARERARADRDADAAQRLEELKKKMGR